MKCVTRVLHDVNSIFCLGTDFSVPYLIYIHTYIHIQEAGPPHAPRLQEAKFVYSPSPGTHARFLPREPRRL